MRFHHSEIPGVALKRLALCAIAGGGAAAVKVSFDRPNRHR
jgi:hypothetical protein